MGAVIGIIATVIGIVAFAAVAPFFLGAFFILLPSSLLLYGIKVAAGLQLDFGQIVTFTLLLTLGLFLIFRLLFSVFRSDSYTPNERAGRLGFVVGATIAAVLLIMNYGFHHDLPKTYASWVLTGDNQ